MKKIFVAVLVAAVMGCDSSTAPEPELAIAVVSGGQQVGPLGGSLPQPIIVRITDAAGNPVAGQQVIWRVAAGGGRTDSVTTATDVQGNSSVRWTLGIDAGTQLLTASARNASISVRGSGVFQFASVAVGFKHACALSSTGDAYCWGSNSSGQLGDGTEVARATPTRTIGGKRFKSITTGWGHTCGIALGGEVFCWGDNSAGQLGLGTNVTKSHTPSQIESAMGFVAIAAGFVHTCGIVADRTVYCWGAGKNTPAALNTTAKFKAISAGEFHTCAVAMDATAFCWGLNSTGELGIGAPFGETRNDPARVSNISGITAITAGVRHTCAVGAQLYCWGRNAAGETGLPALVHDAVPHVVASPQTFTMLGAGNVISCGASATAAYCWGSDGFRTMTSPDLRFSGSITSLGVGFDQVCVVSGGDVYCWGANSKDPVKIDRPK